MRSENTEEWGKTYCEDISDDEEGHRVRRLEIVEVGSKINILRKEQKMNVLVFERNLRYCVFHFQVLLPDTGGRMERRTMAIASLAPPPPLAPPHPGVPDPPASPPQSSTQRSPSSSYATDHHRCCTLLGTYLCSRNAPVQRRRGRRRRWPRRWPAPEVRRRKQRL